MKIYDNECCVMVNQNRYDELLAKEAMLNNIEKLHKKTTSYSFHDVVGYLLDAGVQQQETVESND